MIAAASASSSAALAAKNVHGRFACGVGRTDCSNISVQTPDTGREFLNRVRGTSGGRLFSFVNAARAQPVVVSVFVQDELQLGFLKIAKGCGAVDAPHNFGKSDEHFHIRSRHAFIHDNPASFDKEEGAFRIFGLHAGRNFFTGWQNRRAAGGEDGLTWKESPTGHN